MGFSASMESASYNGTAVPEYFMDFINALKIIKMRVVDLMVRFTQSVIR